jgi:hypothetical protein
MLEEKGHSSIFKGESGHYSGPNDAYSGKNKTGLEAVISAQMDK